MFSSFHSFPLHQAIIENDIDFFLAELKQYPEKIESRDNIGRTPLQLAAMMGNIHAVLNLLYAGADIDSPTEKTPFYLALYFQQYIIAHLLYYAGAKKSYALKSTKNNDSLIETIEQFAPDPLLFTSMALWASVQSNNTNTCHFFKKMLPIISHIEENKSGIIQWTNLRKTLGGFIELLEQKKHFESVKVVCEKYPDIIQTSPFSATFGYWAVINDDLAGKKLIQHDNEHIFLSLHQLEINHHNALFQQQLISLSPEHKKQYPTMLFQEDELTGFAKYIYLAAKYAMDDILKNYINELDIANFVEAAAYSLKVNNHVALIYLLTQKIDYFSALLENSQNELLLIHQFLTEKSIKMTPEKLFSYLSIRPQATQGAVYPFIFRGLSGIVDQRPKDEIQFQRQFFKLLDLDEKQWIPTYFKAVYQRDDVFSIEDIHTNIPSGRWHSIVEHAQRFNFSLVLEEKKQTYKTSVTDLVLNVPDIVNLVRSYLTLNENSRLSEVSSLFLKTEVNSLVNDIEVFLKVLEENTAHNMDYGKIRFSLIVLIIIIGVCILALSIKNFSEKRSESEHIYDLIYSHNSTSGVPCSNGLDSGRNSFSCSSAPPPCDIYCGELDNIKPITLLSFFGIGFFPVYALLPSFCLMLCRDQKQHKTLAAYPIIQEKSVRLFSKFRGDPEFKLTPESKVQEVKETLQKYLTQLTLFKSKKPSTDEITIEIKQTPF